MCLPLERPQPQSGVAHRWNLAHKATSRTVDDPCSWKDCGRFLADPWTNVSVRNDPRNDSELISCCSDYWSGHDPSCFRCNEFSAEESWIGHIGRQMVRPAVVALAEETVIQALPNHLVLAVSFHLPLLHLNLHDYKHNEPFERPSNAMNHY